MLWGDLITLEYGKPVKDKARADGAAPVYGTNGKIGTTNLPPLCKHPSFILGRKGAYRGVHYSDVPFSVIDTAFYAEPVSDKIDLKWAYYKFLTYDINRMDSGSAIPSTDRYEIYKIEVNPPPPDAQRKIVRLLDCLDAKIALNARINDNLQQQGQSVYKYHFIENANPNWKQGVINDLGTVTGGGTPSKARKEYYTQNGISWITPKDLSRDKSKFIYHGANDITELGLKNSGATIMPKGTVLFTSRAPIGYIAVAGGQVTTNQGFKSIIPKKNVGTAYIYYFLKSNLHIIEQMASGSTFKEISGAVMKSVPAIIPDDESLYHFNEFCLPLFHQQQVLELQNQRLEKIRDALLPRLMSGELDVSGLDL